MNVSHGTHDTLCSSYDVQTSGAERCLPTGHARRIMTEGGLDRTNRQIPRYELGRGPSSVPNGSVACYTLTETCNSQSVPTACRSYLPSEENVLTARGVYAQNVDPRRTCSDNFPNRLKSEQQTAQISRCYRRENTPDGVALSNFDDSRTTANVGKSFGSANSDMSVQLIDNKSYINTCLVKKIIDSQKMRQRARTPVIQLCNSRRDVPSTGIVCSGQNESGRIKPDHYSSDASLASKMAEFKISDPDAVSTESQKESGYHSGESVGDQSSATNDLVEQHRITPWMNDLTQFDPGVSGTPDERCNYYFVRAENFMDLYSEQERLGNLHRALSFLNKAIELFHLAANVSGTSAENVLRMRMKHNKAVLRHRKLTKQMESTVETTRRRLPCPPQDADTIPRVDRNSQYQRLPLGSYRLEDLRCNNVQSAFPHCSRQNDNCWYGNTANTCDKVSTETGVVNGGGFCKSRPITGSSWTADDVKDLELYGTLSRKKRNGSLLTKPTCETMHGNNASEFQAVREFPSSYSSYPVLHDCDQPDRSIVHQISNGCQFQQRPERRRSDRVQQMAPTRPDLRYRADQQCLASYNVHEYACLDGLQKHELGSLDHRSQDFNTVRP